MQFKFLRLNHIKQYKLQESSQVVLFRWQGEKGKEEGGFGW